MMLKAYLLVLACLQTATQACWIGVSTYGVSPIHIYVDDMKLEYQYTHNDIMYGFVPENVRGKVSNSVVTVMGTKDSSAMVANYAFLLTSNMGVYSTQQDGTHPGWECVAISSDAAMQSPDVMSVDTTFTPARDLTSDVEDQGRRRPTGFHPFSQWIWVDAEDSSAMCRVQLDRNICPPDFMETAGFCHDLGGRTVDMSRYCMRGITFSERYNNKLPWWLAEMEAQKTSRKAGLAYVSNINEQLQVEKVMRMENMQRAWIGARRNKDPEQPWIWVRGCCDTTTTDRRLTSQGCFMISDEESQMQMTLISTPDPVEQCKEDCSAQANDVYHYVGVRETEPGTYVCDCLKALPVKQVQCMGTTSSKVETMQVGGAGAWDAMEPSMSGMSGASHSFYCGVVELPNGMMMDEDCGSTKLHYLCEFPSYAMSCTGKYNTMAGNKCFQLSALADKSYYQAVTACLMNKGDIASLYDQASYDHVVGWLLGMNRPMKVWVGATKMYFKWSEGMPVHFNWFAYGYPDSDDHECVYVDRTKGLSYWVTDNCEDAMVDGYMYGLGYQFENCETVDSCQGHYRICPRQPKVCLLGWTGEDCTEVDSTVVPSVVNWCQLEGPDSLCNNVGSCLRDFCCCRPGYTGRFCEADLDECASNPCQANQVCVNHNNRYSCTETTTTTTSQTTTASTSPAIPGQLEDKTTAALPDDVQRYTGAQETGDKLAEQKDYEVGTEGVKPVAASAQLIFISVSQVTGLVCGAAFIILGLV